MVRKILQRGSLPPLHPESERTLLQICGLGDLIAPGSSAGDLAPALSRMPDIQSIRAGAACWWAAGYAADNELHLDSWEEKEFLTDWVPRELGPSAGRWIIPQAPLDSVLRGLGLEGPGARRVDFLFHSPQGPTFVVEIDGEQHLEQVAIDGDRDAALERAGIEVVRVSTGDLRAGRSKSLSRIKQLWEVPLPSNIEDIDQLRLVHGASQVHRLVMAIVEGISAGFIAGDTWSIEVVDPLDVAVALLRPYLDLLAAIDDLWGPTLAPQTVQVLTAGTWTSFVRSSEGFQQHEGSVASLDMVVRLESDRSPLDRLVPTSGGPPEVVIRNAWLPVDVIDATGDNAERLPVRSTDAITQKALTTILRAVFAKQDFHGGQLEAITEVLSGRDCAVLLPTGAGKSLIYQVAGLCMPGRTLVIDPITALIEDQIEGLNKYGIDRVTGISAYEIMQGRSEAILQEVASGDSLFVFVSPERLKQSGFRSALRELASTSLINAVVVDESHCVSEWGHDFRTSYLNLGQVVRQTCRDQAGKPPPILALTGTASRAVLRDVLLELGIEQRTPSSIVRPPTFDRPELKYKVIRTNPAESQASLSGFIRSLPALFDVPLAEFYRSRGDETNSGLVFCPHVNGSYGVKTVADKIQDAIGYLPTIYAGSAPKGFEGDWESEKRRAARSFKKNEAPVMVSTKAFGMGIDKSNIRFVVHYGIPNSIESYYQEVGRAGRDGEKAQCGLIFSEFNEALSRQMLDDNIDIETARSLYDEIGSSSADDVRRALFFHLGSFKGAAAELLSFEEIVDEIGPLDKARSVSLPMGEKDAVASREKAIHRLVLLGMVTDYLVEYGGRKFELHLQPTSTDSVVEHLLGFVERSQPGKSSTIKAALPIADWHKPKDAVMGCAEALIAFIYDTIERSRRRRLREMWLAARESDSDSKLRTRILDYLSEGELSPRLVKLAEATTLRFQDWVELYGEILSQTDAREWRGATGRLLASYPDHPGLLVGRALSELLDEEGQMAEFASNLQQACASRHRYGVGDRDMADLVHWVVERAESRGAAGVAIIACAEGGLSKAEWDSLDAAHAPSDPVCAIASLNRGLKEIDSDLQGIVDEVEWRYS